ncbi:hypothetical protein Ssi02_77660 [Sinosporangium siamense]|uniref:Uncharacterized protein n=1 Tax=Sinosporangium siamense TaxID=1367973 RepID=A0A919RR56_9ACTN|nr:hypothetical protein Ssi02_77660 [Sinosporangium siamense]
MVIALCEVDVHWSAFMKGGEESDCGVGHHGLGLPSSFDEGEPQFSSLWGETAASSPRTWGSDHWEINLTGRSCFVKAVE